MYLRRLNVDCESSCIENAFPGCLNIIRSRLTSWLQKNWTRYIGHFTFALEMVGYAKDYQDT